MERSVVGLGKIDPRSRSIVTYRREFSRCSKLRGHRPALLFFHPVSRGARARDYQTAGVRDCCTRQMLSRRPNLLSRVPRLPFTISPPLPLSQEERPATRCGALSLFLRVVPFSSSSSSSSNNGPHGIHREKFSIASCHPLDPLLPPRTSPIDRETFTRSIVWVPVFLSSLFFSPFSLVS